ncbi:FAD/NAD(P)-binding protein [Rhizobium lentis]|nr:FAD/NAD(P)-binding protein [Rhizobium lentis]
MNDSSLVTFFEAGWPERRPSRTDCDRRPGLYRNHDRNRPFQESRSPFHLVMFDPRAKIDISEGISQPASTVLTSRVRDLSVDPALPDDFRRWLERDDTWRDRLTSDPAGLEHAFVPGDIFSSYVYKRFSEALTDRPDVVVQFGSDAITAIGRHPAGGYSVFAGAEQPTRFDAVFLATGYGLRETSDAALADAAQSAIVIGSGIHAVDRALGLLADSRISRVTLISESGFLPQSHAPAAVGSVVTDQPLPKTLRGAFRFLREAARRADLEGSGWQGVMNGFRSRARDIWTGLAPEERARFKRHVKAVYDSHRNRLPPEHYQRLHHAIASGAIAVRKGKVNCIATNGVLFSALTGPEVLPADLTIDCRLRPSGTDSPPVRSLIVAGLATRDELDIGIVVDDCGRTRANPSHGVFAMGTLGLGSLPDIDLVPQIVQQSHAAASVVNNLIGEAARAVSVRSDFPARHAGRTGDDCTI